MNNNTDPTQVAPKGGSQQTIQTTTKTTGHQITLCTSKQITHMQNNSETNVDLRTGIEGFQLNPQTLKEFKPFNPLS